MNKDVIVYTLPGCPHCQRAKEFLNGKNIKFKEVNVADDEAAKVMIVDKTGQFGTPVIQIGEEFIAGFDKNKIEKTLKK